MLTQNSSRYIGLDVLRGLAILLVLFRHSPVLPGNVNITIKIIFDVLHRGGWVGVDLFFVLSGFLISGLIFREVQAKETFSIKNFLLRRALRIYPPFYLLIAATPLFLPLYKLPPDLLKMGYIFEILYLQNYTDSFWGHTWSLAVEEHFYLFLPWLLYTLILIKPKRTNPFSELPYIFIFLSIACLVGRVLVSQKSSFYWTQTVNPTHLRMDSLMAGVIISYFYHLDPKTMLDKIRPLRFWLLILGFLLLTPAFIFPLETSKFITTFGLTAFYLGSSFLLLGVLEWKNSRFLITKTIAFIGFYSYSIYLWHRVIELWFLPLLVHKLNIFLSGYMSLFIFFSGAVFLGAFMGMVVEVPVLKLRNRLIPTTSRGLSDDESKTINAG